MIDLKLNAKQSLAWDLLEDDKTTEILYGGGAGGGKSFLGVAYIITMCVTYPGTRWLIGRSELEALKKTTLNTFFDVCSMWGIKGDDVHYKYNVHEKTITFKNESEILLFDLKLMPSDPNFDGLGSLELTGAFIDEANQVTEKAKNIVSSRLARCKNDKYSLLPKLLMTCNPAKGWVYDEFYKKHKDGTLEDYKGFIQALPTDNPALSKHSLEQLKKLDDFSKRRLLYGEWEYEDTLALVKYDSIIKMFNTDEYLQPVKSTYYLSCDIARLGADKTVIVLWRDLAILKIFTLTKATVDVTINKIKELVDLYKIDRKHIVIDTGYKIQPGMTAFDKLSRDKMTEEDLLKQNKKGIYFSIYLDIKKQTRIGFSSPDKGNYILIERTTQKEIDEAIENTKQRYSDLIKHFKINHTRL